MATARHIRRQGYFTVTCDISLSLTVTDIDGNVEIVMRHVRLDSG